MIEPIRIKWHTKKMTQHGIEERLAKIVSPAAPCFAALSSGEQKTVRYMVEYLALMMQQLNVDLEEALSRCEPEFRAFSREPKPQNACVIDPVTFSPIRSDALNTPSVNLDTLDNSLKDMICLAVSKTQEVIGKHEWLKTETMPRNARIGHFVTNLRRDLTVFISRLPDDIKDNDASSSYRVNTLKAFLQKFYDADMWHDVGVPKPYNGYGTDPWRFSCVYNNRIWRMDGSRIMDICNKATELSPDQEASKSIEDSLASLQREMYPLKNGIDKMNRINRESEQIIGNLCAIVEGR